MVAQTINFMKYTALALQGDYVQHCMVYAANACITALIMKMQMRDFEVLFLRKAHNTEHPSRGCPHLVLISQLSRLKQCG